MRGFATYHPLVVIAFFIGAIVLSVLVNCLVFQIIGFVCAASFYLCIRGRVGMRVILGLVPVFIVLSLINPLFNTQGQTVLFTWFASRPYTLQSLIFGISTSLMFVSVLLWFFSFNKIMTSDKLTYLFGGIAPALTLVITMVLRLVPSYHAKIKDIAVARAGIGKSANQGSIRNRLNSGMSLLSALTTWALEGSIITADSMRSRGYGTGKHTTYAAYRFTLRDGVCLLLLLVLFGIALASILSGAVSMEFFPSLQFPLMTPVSILGLASYSLFLLVPTFIHIQEAISWSISLSKI